MRIQNKAISPMIATVILVAFAIAIAIIVTSSLTTVIKSQTAITETSSKSCTGAAILITSTSATASNFQIALENEGSTTLSNFTITAKMANNSLYTNTSAAATLSIAKGSSAIITLNDINSTIGCPLSSLRVSAGNCPISIEIDNATKSVC